MKTDKEDIKRLITLRWRLTKQIIMSKNRLHSVVQGFNLHPPEGGLLTDKNKSWWERQTFTDLTGFQVDRDLEIVKTLEWQKEVIDQKRRSLQDRSNG